MSNNTEILAAPPSALLTTAEAAVILSLSPRTLEQLRVKGNGPP